MHVMQTALRGEMQEMQTTLRGEMQEMQTTLRGEMQVMDMGLRTEMQALRADFLEGVNRQVKWLVTFAAAWTTVLVTLVRLVP